MIIISHERTLDSFEIHAFYDKFKVIDQHIRCIDIRVILDKFVDLLRDYILGPAQSSHVPRHVLSVPRESLVTQLYKSRIKVVTQNSFNVVTCLGSRW